MKAEPYSLNGRPNWAMVTLDNCDSGGSGALTVYNDVNVSDLGRCD